MLHCGYLGVGGIPDCGEDFALGSVCFSVEDWDKVAFVVLHELLLVRIKPFYCNG